MKEQAPRVAGNDGVFDRWFLTNEGLPETPAYFLKVGINGFS